MQDIRSSTHTTHHDVTPGRDSYFFGPPFFANKQNADTIPVNELTVAPPAPPWTKTKRRARRRLRRGPPDPRRPERLFIERRHRGGGTHEVDGEPRGVGQP